WETIFMVSIESPTVLLLQFFGGVI
ncbi:MAG: hypothetical protein JWN70_3970, partial [Planctomycetaceae bacterium]|nr:hypothetical protein [Planctomycetaceae bacterium]